MYRGWWLYALVLGGCIPEVEPDLYTMPRGAT